MFFLPHLNTETGTQPLSIALRPDTLMAALTVPSVLETLVQRQGILY